MTCLAGFFLFGLHVHFRYDFFPSESDNLKYIYPFAFIRILGNLLYKATLVSRKRKITTHNNKLKNKLQFCFSISGFINRNLSISSFKSKHSEFSNLYYPRIFEFPQQQPRNKESIYFTLPAKFALYRSLK